MLNASLPEIGRSFGGKHHSTVIHSVRKIDGMRKRDPEFDKGIIAFFGQFMDEIKAKGIVLDSDAYLGFESQTDPVAHVQFYRVPAFESAGGRSLAELIADAPDATWAVRSSALSGAPGGIRFSTYLPS